MKISPSIPLKLLSIYLWVYTPVFILSLLPARQSTLGQLFIRDAQIVNWEFELLFAMIFFVWGIYLWKASKWPNENQFFINFTISATIVHIVWMVIVGVLNAQDTLHMFKDAVILFVLLCLVLFSKKV